MVRKPTDLLQGTLDLLILRVVAQEPLHGWAIARRIQERSRDTLQVNQGSLYPALYRLEDRGWLRVRTGTANGREVKLYDLTALGRKELVRERAQWRTFVSAVEDVLAT